MSAPVPVPCYPWPLSDGQMETLRSAKASLDLEYRIMPVQAFPGSPGRVLCYGRPAPFYTESVVVGVGNELKVDSVKAALRFLLEAPEGAEGGFGEQAWLEAVLGCSVNLAYEMTEQDLRDEEAERRIYGI